MTKGLSATQRTLRELRQQGCICGIVERFNPYAGPHGIRQDLFEIFDLISIMPNGICGVQVCGSDFAAHDRKILESEVAPEWIKAGGTIELWGWGKRKVKRGGKAMIWKARRKEYRLGDFKADCKAKTFICNNCDWKPKPGGKDIKNGPYYCPSCNEKLIYS